MDRRECDPFVNAGGSNLDLPVGDGMEEDAFGAGAAAERSDRRAFLVSLQVTPVAVATYGKKW